MATTKGTGSGGARARPPEDDISGTVAAEPAAKKPRRRRETYVETAARRRKEKERDELREDLRAFAAARPSGWEHHDWLAFLDHLRERGHDTSDPEAIGAALERERLAVVLAGVEGLGPRRVHSLVDRFRTLWSMRHAAADEVAGVPGMNRPVAERLVRELRERYP